MIVVDASVWVSSFITDDSHYDVSRAWFRACEAEGEQMMAPSLLVAEVAGAISRRTGSAALAYQILDDMLGLSALQLVAADLSLCTRAARLAAARCLRGADATYCAIAQMLAVPLVTWDREMVYRGGTVAEVLSPLEHIARLVP
ncbi:MAG: type II toxin-antitoxin system VapC family toxin [Anaerolineae bacterium]